MRLKEKGYLPTTKDGWRIRSGAVSKKAERYYVSVLADVPDLSDKTGKDTTEGIGIDLGLKEFAIVSNGRIYKNINKSSPYTIIDTMVVYGAFHLLPKC